MRAMKILPQLTPQMMNIKTMEKLKKASLHLSKSKAYFYKPWHSVPNV